MAIRTARFQDARQIAEVHVDSWRAAYREIVPDSLLEGLSVEAWTDFTRRKGSRWINPGLSKITTAILP